MDRKHRFRSLKPHLMHYLHGGRGRYESIFRDLLLQERMIEDELKGDFGSFVIGPRRGKSWEVVFDELSQILSPIQIQQLASKLGEDVLATCLRLHEMAEIEKILAGEFGGQG